MALVPNEQHPPTADDVTSPLLNLTPPTPPETPAKGFVSLRWRLLVPVATVVLLMSVLGAYVISWELTTASNADIASDLSTDADDALQHLQSLTDSHQRELFRLQNTGGFAESVAARNVDRLDALIAPNALLAELDMVIVTDRNGVEIMGLQRSANSTTTTFDLSQQGNLSAIGSITPLLQTPATTTELIRLNDRLLLVSGSTITTPDNQVMGALLVGSDIAPVLSTIAETTTSEALLFGADGTWLAGVAADRQSVQDTTATAVVGGPNYLQERTVLDDVTLYRVYAPLTLNGTALGVLRLSVENSGETVAAMTQHTVSLMAAVGAALIVISTYIVLARLIERVEQIRDTAVALSAGESDVRNDMPANDEIGELAAALDHYANVMDHEHSALAANLQLHLRETKRLKAIIESISDGLIVLDPHGRPLTMNTAARKLLGIHAEFDLRVLYDQIFDTLGTALAPGIYSLGNPIRIAHDKRTLQAETAAVVGGGEQRLGVIVTLRDISADVEREQHYDRLITRLATDIQQSMAYTAQGAALEAARHDDTQDQAALFQFARDVARNAQSLQGVIDELRDLQQFAPAEIERVQQPVLLSDLLWEAASQWQDTINTAQMHLSMVIPDDEHYVLGDSRRLLWAFGTIIDNAIRYSEQGGDILISSHIVQDGQSVHLVFKDGGLGIVPDDLPHVFERFFRGEVRGRDGRQRNIPGGGQGLYQARRIIEAHAGSISLESTLHVGTTVHVWLPLTANMSLSLGDEPETETRGTSIVPRVFRFRQLFPVERDEN
jgi:signal transduction histidine kinase